MSTYLLTTSVHAEDKVTRHPVLNFTWTGLSELLFLVLLLRLMESDAMGAAGIKLDLLMEHIRPAVLDLQFVSSKLKLCLRFLTQSVFQTGQIEKVAPTATN